MLNVSVNSARPRNEMSRYRCDEGIFHMRKNMEISGLLVKQIIFHNMGGPHLIL